MVDGESTPEVENKDKRVSPSLILGLVTFVALLMFASAYLVDALVEAEAGAAEVAGTELSTAGAFYASTSGFAYILAAVLWVGIIAVTSGCRKRQRVAIAGCALGLVFAFGWHIGARMAF